MVNVMSPWRQLGSASLFFISFFGDTPGAITEFPVIPDLYFLPCFLYTYYVILVTTILSSIHTNTKYHTLITFDDQPKSK
jgi:hypothetical protein